MKRAEFIKKFSPLVAELSAGTGLFPEVVFAQAIIESSDAKGNFGNGYNVRHGNNYFGVRPSSGWHGEVIENPNIKSESKLFRKYESVEDSIRDYFKFLQSNKRYKKAGVFEAANVAEQAAALQRAGYAGNASNYADLITKVGSVVSKVLSGSKEFVSKNKKTSGGLVLAVVAVAGAIIYFRKN